MTNLYLTEISCLWQHEVWPGQDKNKLSVGELWLNMLIFYTEEFDMMKNVISIRCRNTLSKFEKLWISKGIAIEDPFDLAHNLGCALTRKSKFSHV